MLPNGAIGHGGEESLRWGNTGKYLDRHVECLDVVFRLENVSGNVKLAKVFDIR